MGAQAQVHFARNFKYHSLPAMAKAMKAMKAAAMKAMKKKSVSKIAKGRLAKVVVLRGNKEKTSGGLTAKDLTKNKFGKIVSKKMSALSKKRFATSPLKGWIQAVQKAKKELGLKGFIAIKKGTPVYKK